MAEKTRYSDEELQEFKEIIDELACRSSFKDWRQH